MQVFPSKEMIFESKVTSTLGQSMEAGAIRRCSVDPAISPLVNRLVQDFWLPVQLKNLSVFGWLDVEDLIHGMNISEHIATNKNGKMHKNRVAEQRARGGAFVQRLPRSFMQSVISILSARGQ